MRPRRSRFIRIYHRLTRRTPDRRAQWRQIRGPGNAKSYDSRSDKAVRSCATTTQQERLASAERIFLPADRAFESLNLPPQSQYLHDSTGNGPPRGALAAALAASLFLLACAYAAFSGWMHSSDNSLTWLGLAGAALSLLSAALGISLTGSSLPQGYIHRFLGVSAVGLAAAYGLLLFVAVAAH